MQKTEEWRVSSKSIHDNAFPERLYHCHGVPKRSHDFGEGAYGLNPYTFLVTPGREIKVDVRCVKTANDGESVVGGGGG
jgi:peroxiredoxin